MKACSSCGRQSLECLVARLSDMITTSDKLSPTRRAELRGVISTKPGLARFLRTTPGGLLRVDAEAVKAEAKLDGKYLLRSSDPALSAADIALGYKQLAQVERGWRDMKQLLELRPVYHRREDRIRARPKDEEAARDEQIKRLTKKVAELVLDIRKEANRGRPFGSGTSGE